MENLSTVIIGDLHTFEIVTNYGSKNKYSCINTVLQLSLIKSPKNAHLSFNLARCSASFMVAQLFAGLIPICNLNICYDY